ncbi:hypothetical protein GOP47_0022714 [Adiantum capillus-veneris]|uniref:Uncharacterized protein n=1 Tax=Adiantum capillus-veneris TaxID=13818 RepID=A0A9D4U6T5_ADICA|nr:hypothetical protein GOP47_0022714 [Adiantum capillus-veneris]
MSNQLMHRSFRTICTTPTRLTSRAGNKAIPDHFSVFYQSLQGIPSLSSSCNRKQEIVVAAESGQGGIQPITTQEEVKHEEISSIHNGVRNASDDYSAWDSITSQMAGSATFAFLLLQLPQIYLNYQNLMKGNTTALFAVPWMGQLTGLLGNLSLLSYFAKKREVGAMVVQAVGVVTTWVVLLQLTMAGSMPTPAFTVTSTSVGIGFLLNFLNYKKILSPQIWEIWEDAITVGGLGVLPQVMWSTFDTVLPPSVLPGLITMAIALSLVVLRRLNKLSSNSTRLLSAVSAWTATLLFMWAPVAQMWTNYLNPTNIRGLSVYTVLLAMIGNGLLLPRALFTRDRMWFTGASWGTLFQGWGILVTMYLNKCILNFVFWGTGAVLAMWLGMMLATDAKVHSLSSPLSPLGELFFGKVPAKSL